MRPIRQAIMRKRWCLTLYPTQAYAQDAEMSLREFESFVYATTFADQPDPIRQWKKLSAMQQRLIGRLRGADEIRIVGAGSDLKFSVKGRTFINADGRNNMPDGEIFTGPVESSAEGFISYDFPVCVGGREVDGVRLAFRKGKVVEASAAKNEKYLLTMLDCDAGARRLGELGIGTNRMISKFIKNILFDEKIGGTIHLALGNGYPETGSKNISALHWDMIKDLRRGGAVYVDGEVFQKDGRFVK
jgi:aminopeptidase